MNPVITINACCPRMMDVLAEGKFQIAYDHFGKNEYVMDKMLVKGTSESRYCPFCGTRIDIELSIRGESYDGSHRFDSLYQNRFAEPEYVSKAKKDCRWKKN